MTRPGYEKLHAFLTALPPDQQHLGSCCYDDGVHKCVLGSFFEPVPPEDNRDRVDELLNGAPHYEDALQAMGLTVRLAMEVQYVCDAYARCDVTMPTARERYARVIRWLEGDAGVYP